MALVLCGRAAGKCWDGGVEDEEAQVLAVNARTSNALVFRSPTQTPIKAEKADKSTLLNFGFVDLNLQFFISETSAFRLFGLFHAETLTGGSGDAGVTGLTCRKV